MEDKCGINEQQGACALPGQSTEVAFPHRVWAEVVEVTWDRELLKVGVVVLEYLVGVIHGYRYSRSRDGTKAGAVCTCVGGIIVHWSKVSTARVVIRNFFIVFRKEYNVGSVIV